MGDVKTILKAVIAAAIVIVLVASFMQDANSLPSGKVSATKRAVNTYQNFHPRISVVKGVVKNTAIYCAGITTADRLLSALYFDTVAAQADWRDYSDSTFIQANDTIQSGMDMDSGYCWIFWHKSN
jgi:predicted small secreted protein